MEQYNRSSTGRQYFYRRNLVNGNPNGTETQGSLIVSQSLNGHKLPTWEALVASHQSATTPCSGTSRSLDPGSATLRCVRVEKKGAFKGQKTFYASYGTLWTSNSFQSVPSLPNAVTDNTALMRFYSDANSKINQASGMVALGELRETVRMLKRPFRSLRDLLVKREKSLKGYWNRKHRVRSVRDKKLLLRDYKNAVAGTWLEAQFGLQPLCNDISDVLTYLQHRRFQLGAEYFKIRGSARTKSVSVTSSNMQAGVSAVTYQRHTRTVERTKVRYIGELKVDPLEPGISYRDFGRLGLSLRQFAPVLWEITPWSFLIDYFADVGGLIDSFNVPREDIVWFNKTMRSESEATLTVPGYHSGRYEDPSFYVDAGGYVFSPARAICGQFVRSGGANFQLPRPKISFDLPSGKQLVNLFALAAVDSKSRFSHSPFTKVQ